MPASATRYVAHALSDLHRRGVEHTTGVGSLVFADLSDFTPLTERLAKQGQVGSEKLTDLLNALFAPMLDIAIDLGGDLLKFGGDALLIHFRGERHEESAVAAAFHMRAALRAASRASKVKVAMSVGVASGEIWLHLLGHRHPELVVAGPAVDRCLELEAAADAGQILADVSTLALDQLDVRTSIAPVGVELIDLRAPAIDVRSTDRPAVGGSSLLEPQVGVAVRDGAQPEHRRAVVAFLSFDIDADRSADERHALLSSLFGAVQDACTDLDICMLNCDVQFRGAKLTLTAGVPLTTGDDADRMLQCVTRIASEPAAIAAGVRIGVNEGRVFAGPIGSAHRRSYTIMGDSVNLAARVMSRAARGTVLATTEVLERTREQFIVGETERFTVKGKSNLIEAATVEAPTGHVIVRAAIAGFVGRDDERDAIVAVADEVRASGQGAVVELVGEAGIGKSRLLREIVTDLPFPMVLLECGRYLSASPYGAVVEAFRRLVDVGQLTDEQSLGERLAMVVHRAAPHLEPWLPLLGIPLGIEFADTPETAALAEEFRVGRTHRVFGEFLAQVFAEPHLLVIEDAHWLDAASGDLLHAVLAGLLDRGWLVVATRRPEPTGWNPPEPTRRLDLGPLGSVASRQLASDLLAGRPTPDHVARLLVERSQGNPLFLEELTAAVAEGARVEELPDRVEVLIEAHIDRLSPAARLTLRTSAVLGMRFDHSLLDALVDSADSSLEPLAQFLELTGTEIRFRHALYRDTAYQALPVRERVRLHERAARVLEERAGDRTAEFAELLAVHWFDAQRYDRAWGYLRSAADRARSDLAPLEASQFLERAIRCIPHLGDAERAERVTLDEELGLLYDQLARYAEAEACFRRARRRAPDAATAARLRGREGRVARSTRSLSTAVRRYRRALTEVPDDAPGVRAQLCVGLAGVLERQGRHTDKLDLLHQATRDATDAGDASTLAHAHLVLGNTYGDLGIGDAEHHLTTALGLFEQLDEIWGVASARNNLGVEAYYAARWAVSIDHYGAALDAYRRIGDEFNTAMALNNIGEIHSDQGEWDLAMAEFEEARRIWGGSSLGVAFVTANIARLLDRRGELRRARDEFAVARSGLEDVGASGYLQELDARYAVLLLRSGDPSGSLELARAVLGGGGELQATVRCQLLRTCALAEHAMGSSEPAAALLAEAIAVARSSGADYEHAATLMARARILGDETASAKAAAIFDELGVLDVARMPG